MRLFSYYALHTLKNQIKKLFKTWLIVFFLVCALLGGLLGFGGAWVSDHMGGEPEDEYAELEEEYTEEYEDDEPFFLLTLTDEPLALFELIAGAIILAVFVFDVFGADKNGSAIFLPADAKLLFPSPMRPQSVLMFRLATQLGVALAASLWLLFQLPSITAGLGLGLWAGLSLVLAWALTILTGRLLQTLLYVVSSTRPGVKPWLRRSVYILLALLAGGYYLYWHGSGLAPLDAAIALFCGRASRLVPFWGWIKGLFCYAAEGSAAGALGCLSACVLGGAALAWVIWHVRADFYEDAMARSEEMAELLDRAQSEGTGIVRRKKDRSDRLRRDGFRRGSGANVYFFKTMYNRFRFAHLGFFTKTMELYIVAAAGIAALCRFVIGTDAVLPAALVMAGLAFFRALGDPLSQDTELAMFIMIPERTGRKLFFSLMGGVACCALDALPAMLAAALLGANFLRLLAWLPFIASVDMYATATGSFIGASVNASAGKQIKQIVQVMFVYFGLLPDIAIIAVLGFVFDRMALAAVITAGLNALLGLLFLYFTALLLEPKGGRAAPEALGYTET